MRLNRKIIFPLLIIAAAIAAILFSGDSGRFAAVRLLLLCAFIAFAFGPFLPFDAIRLADGGLSPAISLGFGCSFFLTYLVVSVFTKADLFTAPTCIACTAAAWLIMVAIRFFKEKAGTGSDVPSFFRKSFKLNYDRLFYLSIFAVLFLIAFYIKGFRPEIDSTTEQYMDYGFLTMMFRQKTLPPEDFWMAGHTLNYYYLGQALVVYALRLAAVTPEYGYNLFFCMHFANTVIIVYTLVRAVLSQFSGIAKRNEIIGGIVGTLATVFAGNGHYLVYGLIIPLAEKITGKSLNYRETYWFPDSTIYVGNYPSNPVDHGKNECLAYSYVLGDLHAHVIATFFTFTVFLLLTEFVALCKTKNDDKEFRRAARLPIAFITSILALFTGLNYWDAPIYYVITGAVILFCHLARFGAKLMTVVRVLIIGLVMQIAGGILMIPFSLRFEKMMSGIRFCENHTPAAKFVVLWILPITMCIVFAVVLLGKKRKDKDDIFADLFMAVLILCAIGLIFVPEVIYVRDIYEEGYARFNTMFKMTYEAFHMFGLIAGCAVGYMLSSRRMSKYAVTISVFVVLLSGYMINSCRNWFGNIFVPDVRSGISGTRYLYDADENAAELAAIDILNSDPRKNICVIEAAGESYTPSCRLSVFAGVCDIIGWNVHEWMWNNSNTQVTDRQYTVRAFYESGDADFCRDVIKQYGVDYIFVGPRELTFYETDTAGFADFGKAVWTDGTHMLIKTE